MRDPRRILWIAVAATVAISGCNGASGANDVASTTTTLAQSNPDTTTTTAAPEGSLESIVAAHIGEGRGAAIVGVFESGSSMMAAAGADADGIEMTPERPWPTASLAKVFTATAIMQLADMGELELDNSVSDYVEFPISDEITVRNLLQHRSGIPTVPSFTIRCPGDGSFAAIERVVEETEPAPGQDTSYSNTNYLVLGRLIESTTGMDAGDWISESIFEPLEMDSTYWFESQSGPNPWWPRKVETQGAGLNDCGELGRTFGTDGAAITNTEDMDRFYRGLLSGELISEHSLSEVLTMESELFGFRYGLGILEMTNEAWPDDVLYGFGGSTMTYSTAAFHDPTKNRTVAVFTTRGDQETLLWEVIAWANSR